MRFMRARNPALAKMRKKADLPTKTCAACGLPFTWRRKWEKVWEEVKYCSDRCRARKKNAQPANVARKPG